MVAQRVYFGVVDYFAGDDEFSDAFADVEVVVLPFPGGNRVSEGLDMAVLEPA